MQAIRVRRTDDIVCYDNEGVFTAARVSWTMRFFGAERVRVLNGGIKKWNKEGRKTESGPQNLDQFEKEGDYNYRILDESRIVRNVNDMHKIAA
jgi:3-mercaptopyruvate sulfurtransferase SseA